MSSRVSKPAAPITVTVLQNMKRAGEKIVCLTAYDASFAGMLDEAGVEVLLVGDSLGMVVQGRDSTIPVTMDDMVYHSAAVDSGRRRRVIDGRYAFYELCHATAGFDKRRPSDAGGGRAYGEVGGRRASG